MVAAMSGADDADAEPVGLLPVRYDLVIAGAVTLIYLVATLTLEKITACNGFGHDGCGYGTWALDFPRYAIDQKLNDYQIQRSLPSLVAWGSLKLLGRPITPPAVVRAFQLMNTAMMFIGVAAWTKIARILRIRAETMLVGTLAMFGTYGIVKFTTWYPVLGDLWGYAFGFVCLWAYLARRFFVLPPLAVLGTFAWPSLIAPAAILMFLYGAHARPKPGEGPSGRAPRYLNHVFALAVALAWTLWTLHLARMNYWPPSVMPIDTMPMLFRFSVLVVGSYFYFAMSRLVDVSALWNPLVYARSLMTVGGIAGIASVVIVRYATVKLSVPGKAGFSVWFSDTAILATMKPGIFTLAYVIYFGPLFLVLVLRWSRVVALMARHGIAIIAAMVIGVVFGADSEERHGYTFVALAFPFAVKLLDELDLDAAALRIFAVLTVVFSKIWITLPPDVRQPSWDFPNQTLFLSQGPWMSNLMYVVQGAVVVGVAVWLHRVMKARESKPAPA
jgi:hypothetical protein